MLSLVPDARDHDWSIVSVNKLHLSKAGKACQKWLIDNILDPQRLQKIPGGEYMIAHLLKESQVEDSVERMMEILDEWVDSLPKPKGCSSSNPTSDTVK